MRTDRERFNLLAETNVSKLIQRTSKRAFLADLIDSSGLGKMISLVASERRLIVLNYHRIGDDTTADGDPNGFSANGEEFQRQMSFLKGNYDVINPADLHNLINGKRKPSKKSSVLLTFDDGYKDSFTIAYPILSNLGLSGLFFVPTSFIGSGEAPWWDQIASILSTAKIPKFQLNYPNKEKFSIEDQGLESVIRSILQIYKSPTTLDGERFIEELREVCQGETPVTVDRSLFVSEGDMQVMVSGGMHIGNHGHTHRLLSKLSDKEEDHELYKSTEILSQMLGKHPEFFAYPVGSRDSFTRRTQANLAKFGYKFGFSFYGGINHLNNISAFDLHRIAIFRPKDSQFRTVIRNAAAFGVTFP